MPTKERPRARLSGLMAALATAIALLAAGVIPAMAAETTTQNACHYSYDGYWRNIDITLSGDAPGTAAAGQTITLDSQGIEAALPDWLASYGYGFGLLHEGENDLDVHGWVAIEGTNTEEGVQVHEFETVATTTITAPGGSFQSATPFEYTIDAFSTEWTATGGDVEFRQAASGSLPTIPAGRDGADLDPKGSVLLHVELGTGYLNLDCVPGAYTDEGGNREETTAEPFATVEVPFEQCIASPNGTGAFDGEIVPSALVLNPGRAEFVLEGRTFSFSPSISTSLTIDQLRELYVDGALANQSEVDAEDLVVVDEDLGTTAASNENPMVARAAIDVANATEPGTILADSGADAGLTWTVLVNDPTPDSRGNGDETYYQQGRRGVSAVGEALSVSASLETTEWTPTGEGPLEFSLAAPGQIPAVQATDTLEVLPHGSMYMYLGAGDSGVSYDCVRGSIEVSDDGVPFDPAGRDASGDRYTIATVDVPVVSVPVKPLATYQCISGLGRYAGREIEPLELTLQSASGIALEGDSLNYSPRLTASLPHDLLVRLYTDSHNLIDGSPEGTTNTFPAFAWAKIVGSNTAEGAQVLATEDAEWTVIVKDPTPDDRSNGDESFHTMRRGALSDPITTSLNVNVTLEGSGWTPTGGDVEFSLAPAGQLDDLQVLGKGYADTPYEVDAYGSVFFRAETNRYGANFDCVHGDVELADPDIAYSNLGRGDPATDPASGSTGRYALTETPIEPLGSVDVQAKAAFQCISGLGRYAGREIQPLEIGLVPGSAGTSVAKGGTYSLSGARLVGTLPQDLLARMYADSHNLIDDGSNEFPAFAWVAISGTNTAEGTQTVAVETTWSVQVSDPTPGDRTNGDESIQPVELSVELPATTWNATGDAAPVFSIASAGQLDDLQVLGKGYADTPYEVDAYGSVFMRAETNRYGANLDCVRGGVTIANPDIPYSNLGRGDPTTDPASGSTGRYALTEAEADPFLTLTFAAGTEGSGAGSSGERPDSPLFAAAAGVASSGKSSGAVTLSAQQLLVNQRISQAAIRRVNAVESWIEAGIEGRDIAGAALGPDDLGAGITLGDAPARDYTAPNPRPLVIAKAAGNAGGASRVSATRRQLAINQRISQAAVRRANALAVRLSGKLTGGDVKDGSLTGNTLAPTVGIAGLGPVAEPPAKSATTPAAATQSTSLGGFTLSAAQLRVNQRISQAAVRRANVLRQQIAKGLDGSAFADKSITAQDVAPGTK